MAVANVILNRVAAGSQHGFADDVVSVIEQVTTRDDGRQTWQFEPIQRFGSIAQLPQPPENVRQEIVDLIGNYQDYSQGATFFYAPAITDQRGTSFSSNRTPTVTLGGHQFHNGYGANPDVVVPAFSVGLAGAGQTPVAAPGPTLAQRVSGIVPRNPVSFTETEAAAANFEGPSFGEVAEAAIAQNWLVVQAWEASGAPAPDPNWDPDMDFLREVTADIPEEYWGNFEVAHSSDHAMWIRERTLLDLQRSQTLAEAGGWGTFASIASGFLDPVNFIPVGGAVTVARSGNRIRNALMAGASAAAFNASYEAALVNLRPTGDNWDIAYAAAGGFLLGGAIGGLSRRGEISQAGRRMMQDTEAERAGMSVGASTAPVRPNDPMVTDADELLAATVGAPTTAFGRVRASTMGRLLSSRNPFVRAFSSHIAEDAVGNADRTATTSIGATEVQQRLFSRTVTNFRRVMNPAFNKWAERQGIGRMGYRRRAAARNQFGDLISDSVRNTDPTRQFDPEVQQVATAFRDMTRQFRELAQNPGLLNGRDMRAVRGFEELADNPNYVPRYIDGVRVNQFIDKYGTHGMRRMIAGSLRENLTDVADETIDKIAKGYVSRISRLAYGEEVDFARAMEGDPEYLKDILGDVLDQDGIDYILRAMEVRQQRISDSGNPSRSKRRLWLDENYTMAVPARGADRLENVRIADILNNNVEDIVQRYSREMSGLVARAQIRVVGDDGQVLVDGITSNAEWQQAMTSVRGTFAELGGRSDTVAEANAAVKRLDWLHDQILGRPHAAEGTRGAEALRFLRKFQFLRVMGQVGFAQIPEIGNIISQTGWRAALGNMPILKGLRRNSLTGQLDDELVDEIESFTGIGAERLNSQAFTRMTEWGSPQSLAGSSDRFRAADNFMDKAQVLVSDVSGLAPVNTFMNRWVARAIVHRYAKLATNRGPIPKSVANRLRAMGISDDVMERILGQFRSHASRASNGRVSRLNMDKWTDDGARVDFENALYRESRRIVQQNDPGQMMTWMSHPLARVLTQFRTFMIGAWEKQFLYNIHMKDFQAFSTFTTATVFAGLTWMVQSHLRALALPEHQREEYLERNLSAEAIGLASFQRAGWSTLWPSMVDWGAQAIGQDPVFDFRTTGLGTGLLGNPTLDFIDSAGRAPGTIIGPLTQRDDDFDQEDAASLRRLLPLQNFLPFQAAYSWMMSGLPESD